MLRIMDDNFTDEVEIQNWLHELQEKVLQLRGRVEIMGIIWLPIRA
jgi:hypothetical protein